MVVANPSQWARHPSSELMKFELKIVARSEGFEPPTPRFEVWCSIQLSYERLFLE
jgi:hypothetical protein